MKLFATVGVVCLLGCAPALPSLSGGRTTPEDRVDLALGGAARIPLGELVPNDEPTSLTEEASGGGVVPVALFSWGMFDGVDARALVAGTTLSLQGRLQAFAFGRDPTWSLIPSIGIHFGYLGERRTVPEFREGAEASLLLGMNAAGLLELWFGPRIGAEMFGRPGNFTRENVLRAGLLLGIGAGFRDLHALIELTGTFESWLTDGDANPSGLSLTPAFAIRLRL